eukprot:Hpha_TRINITY_DN18911_c0_g1::TRINITY_DN18911_c0_g1_i1::g.17609::m.17609
MAVQVRPPLTPERLCNLLREGARRRRAPKASIEGEVVAAIKAATTTLDGKQFAAIILDLCRLPSPPETLLFATADAVRRSSASMTGPQLCLALSSLRFVPRGACVDKLVNSLALKLRISKVSFHDYHDGRCARVVQGMRNCRTSPAVLGVLNAAAEALENSGGIDTVGVLAIMEGLRGHAGTAEARRLLSCVAMHLKPKLNSSLKPMQMRAEVAAEHAERVTSALFFLSAHRESPESRALLASLAGALRHVVRLEPKSVGAAVFGLQR